MVTVVVFLMFLAALPVLVAAAMVLGAGLGGARERRRWTRRRDVDKDPDTE